MFSQSVVEQIGYYVYFLKDPRSGEVFYVGKGCGNRVFNHLSCALGSDDESEKLDRIRDIVDSGYTVQNFIIRHGLSEKESFEVEAALIDFVGSSNLSNVQGGHYSGDYGIKTVDEISAMYEAEDFSTDRPVLLININKLYSREMSSNELYEATRKSWVLGDKKNKAEFAIATYRGLTREIYKIEDWFQVPEHGERRWGFNGKIADNEIRDQYKYKSIKRYFKKGAANPIKYLNC